MTPPCIYTHTGKTFWPLWPRAEDVDVVDIAHSLSMQCRFGGHCRGFYSVAEHSVNVSLLSDDPRWGLMHDAAEAYLYDIAKPIKPYLPGLLEIEERILEAVAEKFELALPMPASAEWADLVMLRVEKEALMTDNPGWVVDNLPYPAAPIVLECWGPAEGEGRFLARFAELFAKRHII